MRFKGKIIIFLFVAIFVTSCGRKSISGNGKVVDKEINIHNFNGLSVRGAFDIHLINSDDTIVVLTTDENLIPYINFQLNDSILEINTLRNINRSKELKLTISCPVLKSIDFSGATEIYNDSTLNMDNLRINISGTGRLNLKLDINTLTVNISGGAELIFEGQCNKLNITITGVGNINADKMETTTCSIDISGYGRSKLNVTDQININISGYGKVLYTGNPTIKQNITGSAKIIKLPEKYK